MILKAIKIIFFTSSVLLLGQTTIHGETIAARFQKLMKKGFVQGGEQVMHTKLLAGFSGTAVAERWLHNLTPPPEKETSKRTAENEKDEDEVLPEDFNPADRDSVLRILQ